MYDRKTWLVVILCSGIISAQLYYSSKRKAAEAAANPPAQTQVQGGQAAASGAQTPEAPAPVDPATPQAPAPAAEQLFKLETPEMVFTFTTEGGGIKSAEVKQQYEVHSKENRVLMNRYAKAPIGAFGNLWQNPDQIHYSYLADSSVEGKKLVFIGTHPSGLIVRKSFALVEDGKPGSPYLLDFEVKLENASGASVALENYGLFLGEATPLYQKEAGDQTRFFWMDRGNADFKGTTKFSGGMFSQAKTQLTEEIKELQFGGVANQFFTTVLRPNQPTAGKLVAGVTDVNLTAGEKPVKSIHASFSLPPVNLEPKGATQVSYRVFMGPAHNAMLRQMGDHWSEVMPYGYFSLFSNPLNRLLNWLHVIFAGTGPKWSWGLAIIALTILVRTAIWPLYAKSTRSMKRMSKLQPEMTRLKEKYGDDPAKMNQEMMKLYKTYGVNPLGGCLPMLIQIPIFFGFYRMLQYAVELRGQGFAWVADLSQPDTLTVLLGVPINVLPIVMAITSFIQMAITPKSGDKAQQRMLMLMPFMFFFFCYSFASALALYWTTTNLFSIFQTWLTNKMPEPELKERKVVPGKKSFLERMAEKQQELERARQQREGGAAPEPEAKKKRSPRTGG